MYLLRIYIDFEKKLFAESLALSKQVWTYDEFSHIQNSIMTFSFSFYDINSFNNNNNKKHKQKHNSRE